MFGPHFNIVFMGGRGGILSEPGFRGKYSKIKHTTCIFLTFLSKIVGKAKQKVQYEMCNDQ